MERETATDTELPGMWEPSDLSGGEADTAADRSADTPTPPTAFNQPVQQETGRIELERTAGSNQPVLSFRDLLRTDLDAARWRKLLRLAGTPANASDTPVTLFWDDATMTAMIRVGASGSGRTYFVDRGSFAAALAEIPEPED